MSHTNSTTNYNLPQFITTDKPAWLTDVNNAYSAIDLGIHAAKTAGDNAQTDATQALSDASAAGTTANTANSKAGGAIASISEDFLDSATYAVGDLVMYNNLLYVCSTAVVVPGAWTGSANWSRTTVDNLIPKNSNFSLAGLSDTTIISPSNGQSLEYDGSKWKNMNKRILETCTVASIPFTSWGAIAYSDIEIETSKNISTSTGLIVQSTSDQLWIVRATRQENKKITARVASVNTNTRTNVSFYVLYTPA